MPRASRLRGERVDVKSGFGFSMKDCMALRKIEALEEKKEKLENKIEAIGEKLEKPKKQR
jgi:hypothetical protein